MYSNLKELPVLLLTGYLGSGKTTLVNRILSNTKGIRFAVIVNDIGEVNIDADLIAREGLVNSEDDSLVSLQNGCICCTLQTDLIEQVHGLLKLQKFDYLVIEASGICEPEPIAQTICSIPSINEYYRKYGIPRMDCITTVVDALRMKDEFSCGTALQERKFKEEDIENLIISQIEFCNIVLLNKISEVTKDEAAEIRQIIHSLQPAAQIIECNYADVDIDLLLNTRAFNFEKTATSAGWIRGIESIATREEELAARNPHHKHDGHCHQTCNHEHDEHGHGCHEGEHCHCHHHKGGEVEEYGIGTFVYYRRPALDINRFDSFVAKRWPKEVIRTKGICYFSDRPEMSYMFEQAGSQKTLREAGLWYATAPEEDRIKLMQQDPGFLRDWDEQYGDRMIKLVFIGKDMNKEAITQMLDDCLS